MRGVRLPVHSVKRDGSGDEGLTELKQYFEGNEKPYFFLYLVLLRLICRMQTNEAGKRRWQTGKNAYRVY